MKTRKIGLAKSPAFGRYYLMANEVQKSSPTTEPATAGPDRVRSLVRFWLCFLGCLAVLSVISGLLLFGLFLFMGYRIF